MLFSEPKIPQPTVLALAADARRCFSALQRAENSSTAATSSRSRAAISGFSALQRAENSSTVQYDRTSSVPSPVSVLFSEPKIPQHRGNAPVSVSRHRFSALQRAENSSTTHSVRTQPISRKVSVLFSEPKIPQRYSQQ